ncbi:putative MFS family arabinose efflux permease [Streptomyces avidinii]|uniref:MFS family arabinose efflux permease n=1 Tax=Streptomyces avidinii TaxID=1895 RepID=A0ABS4KXE5_STRAV|nr:putative MFS family arabinose efflux permease [Streptomyces avidinii]
MLELHASTTQIAALAFLGQLPNAVVALPAGALSDRYPKRPQMICADVAAAVALVTIPAAAMGGMLTIGQLYAVAVVLGIAKIVHGAASISYLPVLVEPHRLQRANSRLGAASSVADSAGSNLGAALIGTVGAARSVIVDVLSYLVSAFLVWRIRTPETTAPRPQGRSLARDISEGLHYVAGQPTIRTVIAALSTLGFGLAIMNTYWAYYLLAVLKVTPTAFGVIMGIGGVGSLAGALLAPNIASRIGIGPAIIVGFAVSPLAQVPLLLAGPGLRWQVTLALVLAVQLFWATASGTSQRSLRQIICDPRFQGRMQAASTTVTAGARPLAAAAAGALVLHLGVRTTLTVGALLQLVPVALLLLSPVRTMRHMPAPPPRTALPSAREGSS